MLTALASAMARCVVLLTTLISVPLTIGYLGVERYGLWMTISSVIPMLAFADLGLGNGLLNAIAEANGKDDRETASRCVSSAFFMLFCLAVFLLGVFALAYSFIPWPRVFNVTTELAARESGPAMAVLMACFVIGIPLSVVERVRMGYQDGYANSIWQGLGNLLGLCAVLLAIQLHAGLPWLVLAMAGAPVLTTIINGFVLFRINRPWLLPTWRQVSGETAKRVLKLGLLFFMLNIAVALAYSSDNIVAAQVLGPEAVAQYSVAMKLFSIAPMLLVMLLNPLWPAYGEAIARGDIAWVERTLMKSLVMALLLTGLPSVVLVALGGEIVRLWVGTDVVLPFPLLLGLGIWTVVAAAGNAIAMFLNGANVVRFQVVIATLMALSAICAKVILAGSIGVPGIVWGTISAYTIFALVPLAIYVPRRLASMRLGTVQR